ncbi:MAG: DUF134 domain-containing protein [Desulfovibrio sp.]|nr:DUF134 domain-containing protein [Desulfovibrio sp.]
MRPIKVRTITNRPPCRQFHPLWDSTDAEVGEQEGMPDATVTIGLDMLEAMRLVDGQGLNQAEAAQRMGISTPTLCRILAQGRHWVAIALTEGKIINIEGGNIMYSEEIQGRHGHGRCGGHGQNHAVMQAEDKFQGPNQDKGRHCRHGQGMGGRRRGYAGHGQDDPAAHPNSVVHEVTDSTGQD